MNEEKRLGVMVSLAISAFSKRSSLSLGSVANFCNSLSAFPIGFSEKSSLTIAEGIFRSIVDAESLLRDAFRFTSFGKGATARTTAGVKKSVLVYEFGPVRFDADWNGAAKGSDFSMLSEMLSVVNSGRDQRLSGKEVSWFWDKSRIVKKDKSAKVFGRLVNKFPCSFKGVNKWHG